MPRTTPDPPPPRVFVALSGGGAKGVIHVGAVKALEEAGVVFLGLSGTSAGAIVATLKASGFRADDLADPTSGTTIFDQLGRIDPRRARATDLFGRAGWLRVRIARALLVAVGSVGAGWLGLVFGGLAIGGIVVSADRGEPWGWVIASGWTLAIVLGVMALRAALGGLADLGRLRATLGILLQQRMFPGQPGRVVTMADYGVDGRPELKIVASNLSTRRLERFSSERTPGVAVAGAVIASIAIPFLFRLPMLGGRAYADGGLVSNLPAWGFDEERELDPDAYTIAVDVADAPQRERIGRYGWLGAAFRTALFGSGELNLRAVGRAERITLATDIGLLDFDLPKARYLNAARDAEAAARARIVLGLFTVPRRFHEVCELARDIIDAAFSADPALLAGGKRTGRVRVAVAVPDSGYTRSLRLRYGVGYENCPDERILLPLAGSIAGWVFDACQPRLEVSPIPPELDLPGPENAPLRARMWTGVQWVLGIPISSVGKAETAFVVTIDGNEALSAAGREALTASVARIGGLFERLVLEVAQLEADDGTRGEFDRTA